MTEKTQGIPSASNVPETGHSVHQKSDEPDGREGYFELAQDDAGKWHWCLWTSNGRALAINAVAFDRKNDCIKSIQALIRGTGMQRGCKVLSATTKRKKKNEPQEPKGNGDDKDTNGG